MTAAALLLLWALDPVGLTLGPEADVATTALTGAIGDQNISAAAFDGKTVLVAWRTPLWKSELRVARVTLAGEVLDRRGVRVDGFERDEGVIAVAARPGGFLLTWAKEPNLTFAATATADEGGIHVGPAVLVNEGASDVTSWGPVAAWNGTSFWVLWSRNGAAAGVFAARVSVDGKLLDASPIKLAPQAGDLGVAAEGATTLAAWSVLEAGQAVVRSVRLDAERVLDPAPLTLLEIPGERAGPVSVAAGGGGFAIAAVALAAGNRDVRAVRVSSAGQAGALVPLDSGAGETAGGPTVAWNGTGFHALWSVDQVVDGRHAPRLAGSVLDAAGMHSWTPLVTRPARNPFLAATGAAPLLLWSQIESWDGTGTPVDGDLWITPMTGAPHLVAAGTNAQSVPVVAWNGHHLLVAWEDRRDDRMEADIYAGRLDDQGTILDGTGVPIATGPGPQQAPAVSWDGQHFVLAWYQGGSGLAVARVDDDGKLVDRLVVPGTAGMALLSNPGLCADGDGTLLVWGARQNPAPQPELAAELRGLRFPRGGALGDARSFLLSQAADTDTAPVMRLECNEHGAVAVWSGKLAGDGKAVPLYLGHVARGATAFTTVRMLQPREDSEWAGLASDGQDFLVTWRNFDAKGRRRVVATRVGGGDGRALDDNPRAVGNSNSGVRVGAVWNGREYMVFAINTQNDEPFELRGHRVGVNSFIRERDWFTVAPLALDIGDTGTGSAGVYLGNNRAFLVYDRFFDPDATANTRVVGRFISTADEPDAAVPEDAATPDGGAAPADAGISAPRSSGGGCGCHLGGRAERPGAAALLVLILCAGRRRRRPDR
jgi:hypothetical protein